MTVLDDATPAEVPAESLADAPRPGSRLQRARMPLAKDVVEAVAVSHGVCIRPVPMKVTDEHTGHVRHVDVPCGATLASKCFVRRTCPAPACAPVPRGMAPGHRTGPDPRHPEHRTAGAGHRPRRHHRRPR